MIVFLRRGQTEMQLPPDIEMFAHEHPQFGCGVALAHRGVILGFIPEGEVPNRLEDLRGAKSKIAVRNADLLRAAYDDLVLGRAGIELM